MDAASKFTIVPCGEKISNKDFEKKIKLKVKTLNNSGKIVQSVKYKDRLNKHIGAIIRYKIES